MLKTVIETLGRVCYHLPCIPATAQIEVTNLCNLDCKMCPREKLDIAYEHIPFERMKAIVDRLKGIKSLTLTGWGEPFLHPNIFEMIRYAKEKRLYVQITTNGIFKKDSIIDEIVGSGLDSLSFSIDGLSDGLKWGHPSNAVIERVKQVLQARNDKTPMVTLQSTLHKGGEEQINDLIQFCSDVGADRVNLARLDTRLIPGLDRPGPEEEMRILKNADELGTKLGVRVDCIQYAITTGHSRTIYKLIKRALHQMGRYCLRTYDYIYINHKGEVTPCCVLPNYSIGNILEADMASIWKSSSFQDFRKNQKKICGKCDQWQIDYNS